MVARIPQAVVLEGDGKMSSKQITALMIILLYMAMTIVIGLVVSKRKAKQKASQSNEDFLMAGKSLGPLALAGTLFAANTGGAVPLVLRPMCISMVCLPAGM